MSGRTISSVSKPELGFKQNSNGAEPEVTTFLISDNALLLLGLQQVLQETPLVIARAASSPGPDWLQQLASQPTLVLIDANQNAGRALEAIRQAREQSPEARIVVLADHFDLSFVRLGHEAGVDGFCPAASAPD
ncbi:MULTISPECIES: response regulator transcription factor [Microvirga]|uniref:response regulator transcription factor n=1 Tax=Microvirga TaxID=186650 RepID=UPI00168508FE|nr:MULTISPECIES: response regulator transcription factor [Microvirga]MBD2749569.1 response regulator transcription factor [Microvirga sp.]